MSKLITHIKRLALALCLATPIVSRAETAMNPVTGEVESYTYAYTGDATAWSDITWRDADGVDHTDFVPQVDSVYNSLVIKQDVDITADTIEGWTFNIGLFNGANLTIGTLNKWQGGCNVRVGSGSKLTISAMGSGNTENSINFYVAANEGIAYSDDYAKNGDFNYYFAGEGSVAYEGLTGGSHAIKSADVTLSGTKELKNKKLVSFTSTDKTFTADADIKVKDGDNVLKIVYLASVTADATTLTADSDVGTCELVQTSTGIDLYWVDGDPAALPAPTVYKPSININFTHSGNGLTTQADVGLTDYEVPGTSWNNFAGSNGTYGEVKAVADSTGSASVMSGVSVTVSGTRGSWATSLPSSSNPLAGYIDENAGNPAPTVTVTGIPYYKYRVLVYHSTDSANVPFGYDTINGTNYTYVEDALSEGTTAWGNSGPDGSADAIAGGGNVLVTEAISGSTLTVVGHRAGGDSSARGCIAAIQIIEVKADVGENDLEIAVDGEREYTVTAEDAEKTGTVYLTGSGTLTLAGENKISATTINVGDLVTLVVDADRLDGTTFTGGGTVVFDGTLPTAGKGWTESTWTGTVWLKNYGTGGESSNVGVIGSDSGVADNNVMNGWGNAESSVKFTNVRGWCDVGSLPWTLILEDDSTNYAWYNNNGYAARETTFASLKGSGTFYDAGNNGCRQKLTFTDATGFSGAFNVGGKRIGLGGSSTASNADAEGGTIEVVSGKAATIDSGKTWTARNSFRIYGTLTDNGTLATDATTAVKGSGTVVFADIPSPAGDAWWKNASWTGTVEIKSVSNITGDYAFSDYGNAGSTVKLTNCSGWLKANYTCVPALEIGGTFSWNDGSSGLAKTFKVGTLKGSGTISIPNGGAATAVWQITDDWSGFTGAVIGNNSAAARVLVFGSTLPDSVTAGEIYVSDGATLNLNNSSAAWWGVGMGFVVDGTVKASGRAKWGGGTYMTLGDTGVLELTSTANTEENSNYSNVTGTGTIKYSSTAGWRTFPASDANMPATTLTIQAEIADSLILPAKSNGETVIGNLAGSKNVRSDWGTNGESGRTLTVTQSKDTEWQGKFVNNRITQFNVNAPAEGTPGTLTLSGSNEASIPMQVNASVNLTGTWKGAATVAGTIGGTGTLTGDLTFSAGSTFKAYATDDADGLVVSGTVTYPEEGQVTVDVGAIEPEADVALLKASGLDATKFALTGAPTGATLEVVEGVLTLVVPTPTVDITITPVANATASVTVNGTPVTPVEGVITVEIGASVVVTYTANDGYVVTGSPVEFTATAETTSVDTSTVVPALILATITSADGQTVTPYTDVATAFAAVADDETLTLVGSSVSLTGDVAIDTSFTLAGDAEGTTVSGTPGRFQLNGSVAMTLAETVTVTKQFQFNSKTATLTFPTDKVPTVRPYTAGGCQTGTRDNGDGTSTYYQYLFLQLQVGASNVTLAYYDGGAAVESKQVNEGDELVFTATPAAGYENVVVTVNGEALEPVEGKYTVVVGTVNVVISATATAIPPVAQVVHGETATSYTSLAAAVADAQDGDTVELVANVNEAIVNNNDKAFTIDLNGKIWSSDSDVLTTTAGTITINATNGGTMTTEAEQCCAVWSKGGNVVINGGTFVSKDYEEATVYVSTATGTVTINGGTFQNTDTRPYRWKTSWDALTLNVHNTNCTLSQIVVYGGTFYGNNPANGDDNLGGTFLASGYVSTETTTGVWTVAEVQEVPVTPGAQTTPVDTPEEAAAEAAKVVPSVPTAVAEALDDAQETAYKALFEPKVVEVKDGETTKYAVEVALTEAAETAIQTAVDGETADVAAAAVAAAADPATTPEAEVSTTPGLYYVVEAGSSLEGIAPESCTLATGTSLKLKIPNKGTSGFYRIGVSVTPVEVPSSND